MGSALGGVVRLESVQTKVRVGARRCVQVQEGLDILNTDCARKDNLGSGRGHGVERRVGVEGADCVRSDLWAVSIRLRSARVFGVDETAVSSVLWSGRASSAGRRGSGS